MLQRCVVYSLKSMCFKYTDYIRQLFISFYIYYVLCSKILRDWKGSRQIYYTCSCDQFPIPFSVIYILSRFYYLYLVSRTPEIWPANVWETLIYPISFAHIFMQMVALSHVFLEKCIQDTRWKCCEKVLIETAFLLLRIYILVISNINVSQDSLTYFN